MKIKKYLLLLLFIQLNIQVYSQVVNKNGQQVLENVQNTSDLNKLISSATQAALDLKATTTSPTFTGTVNATAFVGDGSGLTGISGDAITQAGTGLIISGTGTVADPYTIELPAGGSEGQVLKIVSGVPAWADASGTTIFYEDTDGDGYGDFTKTIVAASAPTGYVSDNTDCDDTDANINLATTWYIDSDGDGYGVSGILNCIRPDNGYLLSELSGTGTDDCNDEDANENLAQTWYIDSDGDGYAGSSTASCIRPNDGYLLSELAGTGTGIDDCDDSNSAISPGASESCDGIDNNCNGSIDEGLTFTTYYIDADGDGYGSSNDSGTSFCSNPGSGYRTTNSDCDDSNSSIRPGATEIGGNNIDENCDGNLYVVGDYVDGGVVFYVPTTPTDLNSDGVVDFGLVCSIDDLTSSSGVKFHGSNVSIIIDTDRRKGFGKSNTDILIAQLGSNTSYAPGLATAYTGGGFSDWYLPSKDELVEIYNNRVIIATTTAGLTGGTGFAPPNNRYWSSYEVSSSGVAYYVDWTNGNTNFKFFNSQYYGVRAVRAF